MLVSSTTGGFDEGTASFIEDSSDIYIPLSNLLSPAIKVTNAAGKQ
jgi:hypothetical protein